MAHLAVSPRLGHMHVDGGGLCHLKRAVGNAEACPGPSCPFWEEGAVQSGCGLERLSLDIARPELAAYLLELRAALEQARSER
jgi:hypothetical protein